MTRLHLLSSRPHLHGLLVAALVLALPLVGAGCETGFQPEETPDVSPETKRASAMLSADAQFVGMMDVQSLRERGPERVRTLLASPDLSGSSESAARIRDFLDASGIDVEQDVRRTYLALTRANGTSEPSPSFVVYGSFDRAQVETALQSKFGNDLARSVHEGVTVFTAGSLTAETDRSMSVAVVNDDVIVGATTVEGVTAMLDRKAADSSANASGADDAPDDLMRLAGQGQTAWVVVRDIDVSNEKSPSGSFSDAERLGRAVTAMAASFSLQSDGSLDARTWLVPRDGAAASDVADVARGALAAARQRAADRTDASGWATALNDARVTTESGRVVVSGTLPGEVLDEISGE